MLAALPKPEVIFTHESDLDGLVAGLLLQRLARKLFDATVPLEAYHYHGWKQRPPRENAAWVADLAFEYRLDKLNWVIIDHHPTEIQPKNALLIHDQAKSASLLCYELCQHHEISSPALDRLVHLTNVGDIFLENDPDFVTAGDYANLVKSYGFWNFHALLDGNMDRILDHPLLEVMAVKRRVEDPLGFAWSKDNVVEITPSVGFVETVIGNNNLLVHQLLEQQATPYPILLTMFRKPGGAFIASFRSRNGEALKIAEKLQGGGHPNACGATLPRSIQNIPDAIEYLRKVLNPGPMKGMALNSLEGAFAALEANRS
jgi:oligoribonuclease NrnB/cAMP/cGMP phosphodiesterase (DHH superfamily)